MGHRRPHARSDDRTTLVFRIPRNEGRIVDAGWQVAVYFVALGVLWLFIAQFVIGIVEWLRRLLG